MKKLLTVIERRRRAYEEHPFIRFLRNDDISPEKRLSYAPFSSVFVLSFAELNRDVLPEDEPPSAQPSVQSIINRHAEEDAVHYRWFLDDLKILGLDVECRFSEVLRFLWSDQGRRARQMGEYVLSVSRDADALTRLVVVESIEAMGNVWLRATVHAARRHPEHARLRYFGPHHLAKETGHAIGSSVDAVEQIELSPDQRPHAEAIVHGLFDRMEAFNTELLERVEASGAGDPAEFLRR